MKKLVSIIVPVYNVTGYVDKCIESLLCQSYSEIEIILVDDGSTDDSSIKCDKWAEKTKKIKVIHKENGGQGSARNVGITISKGEYITFLDSDDFVDKDYIEYLVGLLEEYNADVSICEYRDVNENGSVLADRENSKVTAKRYSSQEAVACSLYWKEFGVAPWAKLYRKNLWSNIRFDEERIYEDLATTYKILLRSESVVYGGRSKLNYTHRKNSDIRKPFEGKKLDVITSACEILEFMKKEYPSLVRPAQSRLVASCFFIMFQMQKQDYVKFNDTVKELQGYVKKYRINVVRDRESRRKTRLGALCSIFGFNFTRFVFRLTRKK